MAKPKRKSKQPSTFQTIMEFAEVVDTVFEKLTGKPIASWLREFQQQPRELPMGEQAAATQSTTSLANAYAILGLSRTATLSEVKKRYRDLARLFHPDAPGGYKEAMVLLNNAYERIMREGK